MRTTGIYFFFPQQEALWIKVPIMYLFLTNTQLSLHKKLIDGLELMLITCGLL